MLGKALYRRNRKKVEKVIPGSQTFSSNGTFVVPYETALYSITINAGSRASGDGGNGADGTAGWESGETASLQPGNGGGGGGGSSNNFKVISNNFRLIKGESISISCSYSLVSFGTYLSVATGTAARDGSDGGNGTSGGYGGSGEGAHTISGSLSYSVSGANSGSSGRDADSSPITDGPYEDEDPDMGPIMVIDGGYGGMGGSLGGGYGGDGGGVAISMWTGQTGISYGESGSRGTQNNRNGSITISWVAP